MSSRWGHPRYRHAEPRLRWYAAIVRDALIFAIVAFALIVVTSGVPV